MDKYIILAIISIVSVLSKNKILFYASVTVAIISLLPYSNKSLAFIRSKGLNIGIYALTVAILVPIAIGEINTKDLIKVLKNYQGILALFIGLIASILSTKGINLQLVNPQIVVAVSFGTVIGIAAFGGTATGPIIASGLTYVIIQLIQRF